MLSALTAIAAFPILTLLLFGLAWVETDLMETASRASHRRPADPPAGAAARPAVAAAPVEVALPVPVEPPAVASLPVVPVLPVVAELSAE